ncbi:hypothetical protein BABINDRAFT_163631 [Babjeviella inositovora NRRL Y-12698]|uniref:Pru domain-containing protein n=1 Tax=Babjeviella inositovora NRRL Y-12698 TaxID=984486 RepID=A0A1E3QI42_9ASCO|nr:uncharacterized protein BABINDRAFT_163631 [Babjeviella inositovora NRRL Y-12698]ODQ77383.1 hypothetical protein BABINDRAFT_163631 [Babjeviella inositovora NRRL Y-12698]
MSALVSFNAGRVSYSEATKKCTPEPLKGKITIKASEEGDFFYDFTWAPRESTPGVVSDELLVIAGDVQWKHIASCKTGRVFSLTFLSSGAKNLYWMQDLNDDENDEPSQLSKKDLEISAKITKLFLEEEEKEVPAKEPDTPAPAQMFAPLNSITDAISPLLIEKYVNSLSLEELEPLFNHLPESHERNKQSLLNVLKSGFFLTSASKLDEALANGAGMVVSQALGTNYKGEGIECFLNAVREQGKKEKEQKEEN